MKNTKVRSKITIGFNRIVKGEEYITYKIGSNGTAYVYDKTEGRIYALMKGEWAYSE